MDDAPFTRDDAQNTIRLLAVYTVEPLTPEQRGDLDMGRAVEIIPARPGMRIELLTATTYRYVPTDEAR